MKMGLACSVLFIATIFLMGCEEQEQPTLPPDPVLVDIIYDLHIGEAALNRTDIARQDSISAAFRARIAASHNITPNQMDTWLETLQKSPEHLITVYDSVIARYERDMSR